MGSRNLASIELFTLRSNVSRPTRRTILRIVRLLLCEVCRVYESRCLEIARRLGEQSQLSRPLVFCGNPLYLYVGMDRGPSQSRHAIPKGVPFICSFSQAYMEISYVSPNEQTTIAGKGSIPQSERACQKLYRVQQIKKKS